MGFASFGIRHNELPVMADFLKESFISDRDDFIALSSEFGDGYLEDYESRIKAVKESLNPRSVTNTLKIVTQRLYKNMDSLRPMTDRLMVYLKLSKGYLKIKPDDFGISELKKQIKRKDSEAVLDRLKIMMSNIKDNMPALISKGMKPDMLDMFKQKFKVINDDNLEQYQLTAKRIQLTSQNKEIMNHLWAKMSEISKAGVAIYKYDQPHKARHYTISVLKGRLRNERKG